MKKKNKKYNSDYQNGVTDSLKFLYAHIIGMDHSAGFRASDLAQNHSNMLKDLYNKMHISLVK